MHIATEHYLKKTFFLLLNEGQTIYRTIYIH